ncbi:MAG: ComEC/Rec2 family competence protein [Akkermansiaceae bacterium]
MSSPRPLNVPNLLTRTLAAIPLWSLLFGVIGGIVVGDFLALHYWLITTIVAIALIFLIKKLWVTLLCIGLLLGFGTHGRVIKNQQQWLDMLDSHRGSPGIELSAKVVDTAKNELGPYLLKVNSSSNKYLPNGVHIILTTNRHSPEKLQRGDVIRTQGLLTRIPPLRNPHGFNLAAWRHRQGADIEIRSASPSVLVGTSRFAKATRTLTVWKKHLRQKIVAGLDPDSPGAQIICAVVLGEKPPHQGKASEITESFRLSGTLHVFAVSGLHVGMVAVIIHFALLSLGFPRSLNIVMTIFGMIIYAGITGFHPPAVRAAIMGSILLCGFLLRRKAMLLNSLAASAIVVLLIDGHQLFTSGFQLSYGVLLAIALLATYWDKLLRPFGEHDPFMPRSLLSHFQTRLLTQKKRLRKSLGVSLSAATGSAPLLWFHFGIATPISIIAGIPMMMIVFCILALAMLSISLGSLHPKLGIWINQGNQLCARAAYRTSDFFASIPSSHWTRKTSSPEKGQIIVFDIPYGGASHLLNIGGGILLDSGSSHHFHRHVLPTLQALKIEPDSLIVSHADVLHSGGMTDCLDMFQVKQTLIPRDDLQSASYRKFLHRARLSPCKIITPSSLQRFPIEKGVYLETLQAPIELLGRGKADDSGLVLRLHWHGWRILFMGDAGIETEARLLSSDIDLQADVIITGRNKAGITGSEVFYKTVAPQVIVSSNSHFSQTEAIPEYWQTMMRRLGISVLDQHQTGAVTLAITNNQLSLTPTLAPVPPIILSK